MAILIKDDLYKSYNSKQKKESVYEDFDLNGKRIIVVTGFSGDNSIDRDKEIIDQTKWRPASYDINKVKFMPFHEYNKVPVGRHRWIKAFPNKTNATATKFQAQFGPHEFGLAFGELYLDGIMDSFSEGFEAFKWITPSEKSVDWVRTYIDQERYEISIVTIPANVNARVADMSKAFDEVIESKDETKAVIKQYLFEENNDGIWIEKQESYTIKQMADPDDISSIWKKAIEIKEIQKKTGSGYVVICIDRIEVSQTDPESPMWEMRGLKRKDKDTIDASEYDDDHEIEIELDDDLEIEIIQDEEIEVDLETLVEIGD